MRRHGGTTAGAAGGGATVAAVAARVRARRGELGGAVVETLQASGAGELRDAGALEAALVAVTERYVARFAAGEALGPDDLDAVRPFGADRARQGVPLQAVLDSVTAAVTRAWQFFADAAEASGAATAAAAVDRWFEVALPATTDAVARGYLDARASTPGSLVVDLLARLAGGGEDLAARARAFGWTRSTRHGLIVVAARTAAPVPAARLDDARAALVDGVAGALGGTCRFEPLPHAVVVVATAGVAWPGAVARTAAAVAERHGVVALVSERAVGACEVNQLHRRLTDRLPLAVETARRPGVVADASLRVLRLLASVPPPARDEALGELVARLRALLRTDDGAELVDTAHAVAERGGVVNAAVVLGVDRRTVARRLGRLSDSLGVSLAARGDRLLVELALHAVELR